jgi:hypothetical protein
MVSALLTQRKGTVFSSLFLFYTFLKTHFDAFLFKENKNCVLCEDCSLCTQSRYIHFIDLCTGFIGLVVKLSCR